MGLSNCKISHHDDGMNHICACFGYRLCSGLRLWASFCNIFVISMHAFMLLTSISALSFSSFQSRSAWHRWKKNGRAMLLGSQKPWIIPMDLGAVLLRLSYFSPRGASITSFQLLQHTLWLHVILIQTLTFKLAVVFTLSVLIHRIAQFCDFSTCNMRCWNDVQIFCYLFVSSLPSLH